MKSDWLMLNNQSYWIVNICEEFVSHAKKDFKQLNGQRNNFINASGYTLYLVTFYLIYHLAGWNVTLTIGRYIDDLYMQNLL